MSVCPPAPERLTELRTVIDAQLDLATNGPGHRELDVARSGFEGATVLGLEDTGSRMARLATNVLFRTESSASTNTRRGSGGHGCGRAAGTRRGARWGTGGEHRRPRLNSAQTTDGRYRPVTIERLGEFFMARNAILADATLVIVGIVITIASDSESVTSLITAFVGAVFVGLGLLARAKPGLNHHVMHAAAGLALLGVLGSLGSGSDAEARLGAGRTARHRGDPRRLPLPSGAVVPGGSSGSRGRRSVMLQAQMPGRS